MTTEHQSGRRAFLKKAAYVAPAIVTLSVVPGIASSGSGMAECRSGVDGQCNSGDGHWVEHKGHHWKKKRLHNRLNRFRKERYQR